jgi:hypothetical protein
MCLRLVSSVGQALFNLLKNDRYTDSSSTEEESPKAVIESQPKKHQYNLRNRYSVNYTETSDVNLDSESSDN